MCICSRRGSIIREGIDYFLLLQNTRLRRYNFRDGVEEISPKLRADLARMKMADNTFYPAGIQ